MPIVLIAAMAGKKRVIGRDNDLPWHFSADLKFFKQATMGHAVLMGRKTYQSILQRLGKPLPGRHTIVLTRNKDFKDDRVAIIRTIDPVYARFSAGEKRLFVIGGAEVFEQTLNKANQLLITHIDQEIEGDTFFPAIDPKQWRLESERAETEKGAVLRFCSYARQPG